MRERELEPDSEHLAKPSLCPGLPRRAARPAASHGLQHPGTALWSAPAARSARRPSTSCPSASDQPACTPVSRHRQRDPHQHARRATTLPRTPASSRPMPGRTRVLPFLSVPILLMHPYPSSLLSKSISKYSCTQTDSISDTKKSGRDQRSLEESSGGQFSFP